MNDNRRDFLKKIGLVATITGFESALPASSFAASEKENSILASSGQAVVETTAGKVRGYIHNKIYTYKGIPYGAPTHGPNRYMPPVKPAPWKGVKDTLVYGPVCPQKQNTDWFREELAFLYQWNDGLQHEDCLRLNVWTPSVQDQKKRPVMFWIHGGGFATGSSQNHPSYDGENLCLLGDVVVVSVNHRLNAFGYMDLSAYGEKYAASGNLGMLDLVASLEWVRDNISRFGGDKNNVTIFGQSGGGTKVITLMAMPAAKGLFHKAISQSNSIVQMSSKAYAAEWTTHFLHALKLDATNIDLIQELPAYRILEASAYAEKQLGSSVPADVGRAGLQPVVDGNLLPQHPFDPVAPEISAHIPFMVGTTRNEGAASIDNAGLEELTEAGLKEMILARFPTKGPEIYRIMRKTFPAAKPAEIISYLSAQNPMAYLQAQRKAGQQGAPVYLYMFSWHTPVLDGRPRSFHCSEIPFVFANTARCENYTGATKAAATLAGTMTRAWIQFARTGNPHHAGLPAWPSFNEQPGATMVFNTVSTLKTDPDGDARKMMERIFYNKEI